MTTDLEPGGLLAELSWRGMLADVTPGLAERLASGSPISAYNGFDPTGPSLHVGHLVPVFGMLHLQRHGHRPIAIVGGGTGMIGDPSGRSAERVLQTRETIVSNTAAIRVQLERFLDFAPGPTGALLIDNFDWLGRLGLLDFLRDVGKHFTIPYMLAKDSVQKRLDSGLSFTEFSYMLLQSADFLHLYREFGVELQTGGVDQWGNITAGLELIRRVEGATGDGGDPAHGLSFPLLTAPGGEKFGKTAGNTRVWLDPALTTPYAFYQYWLDSADEAVGVLLRRFTLFDRPSIVRLEAAHATAPERRRAQAALARDITARVHGAAAAEEALRESRARFGGADLAGVTADVTIERAALASALDFATAVGAASSRSEARRLITQGGLTINDVRMMDPAAAVTDDRGGQFHVRIGKKKVLIGRIADA
ncbi:MAG: tyrosine--tRNA ligase [Chloroflexi bacterium]|nr:tyrosine--tRNA ligase [Chloroflexota bacterium]